MPSCLASRPTVAVWVLSLLPVAGALLAAIRRSTRWICTWDYPRLQVAAMLTGGAAAQTGLLPMRRLNATLLGGNARLAPSGQLAACQ